MHDGAFHTAELRDRLEHAVSGLPDEQRFLLLMSRGVVVPPRAFTNPVLARVDPQKYRAQPADMFIQYGVRAGQASMASGVLLVVDLNRVFATLTGALRTPEAGTVVAMLAICLGGS